MRTDYQKTLIMRFKHSYEQIPSKLNRGNQNQKEICIVKKGANPDNSGIVVIQGIEDYIAKADSSTTKNVMRRFQMIRRKTTST